MYKTDHEKGAQETGSESRSRSCCHMSHDAWTEDTEKKGLTDLYAIGNFTEDREECQKELQRHSDEVYVDPEETMDGSTRT